MRNPFKGDPLGVHFAANIFIATTFLWGVRRHCAGLSPIWAISSMVAAGDPKAKPAVKTFDDLSAMPGISLYSRKVAALDTGAPEFEAVGGQL